MIVFSLRHQVGSFPSPHVLSQLLHTSQVLAQSWYHAPLEGPHDVIHTGSETDAEMSSWLVQALAVKATAVRVATIVTQPSHCMFTVSARSLLHSISCNKHVCRSAHHPHTVCNGFLLPSELFVCLCPRAAAPACRHDGTTDPARVMPQVEWQHCLQSQCFNATRCQRIAP